VMQVQQPLEDPGGAAQEARPDQVPLPMGPSQVEVHVPRQAQQPVEASAVEATSAEGVEPRQASAGAVEDLLVARALAPAPRQVSQPVGVSAADPSAEAGAAAPKATLRIRTRALVAAEAKEESKLPPPPGIPECSDGSSHAGGSRHNSPVQQRAAPEPVTPRKAAVLAVPLPGVPVRSLSERSLRSHGRRVDAPPASAKTDQEAPVVRRVGTRRSTAAAAARRNVALLDSTSPPGVPAPDMVRQPEPLTQQLPPHRAAAVAEKLPRVQVLGRPDRPARRRSHGGEGPLVPSCASGEAALVEDAPRKRLRILRS